MSLENGHSNSTRPMACSAGGIPLPSSGLPHAGEPQVCMIGQPSSLFLHLAEFANRCDKGLIIPIHDCCLSACLSSTAATVGTGPVSSPSLSPQPSLSPDPVPLPNPGILFAAICTTSQGPAPPALMPAHLRYRPTHAMGLLQLPTVGYTRVRQA